MKLANWAILAGAAAIAVSCKSKTTEIEDPLDTLSKGEFKLEGKVDGLNWKMSSVVATLDRKGEFATIKLYGNSVYADCSTQPNADQMILLRIPWKKGTYADLSGASASMINYDAAKGGYETLPFSATRVLVEEKNSAGGRIAIYIERKNEQKQTSEIKGRIDVEICDPSRLFLAKFAANWAGPSSVRKKNGAVLFSNTNLNVTVADNQFSVSIDWLDQKLKYARSALSVANGVIYEGCVRGQFKVGTVQSGQITIESRVTHDCVLVSEQLRLSLYNSSLDFALDGQGLQAETTGLVK